MSLKVVFMGTPEFAVPTLEKLIAHHQVLAVVTTPDKPAGRGLHITQSAVKQCALKHELPVLQPEKLKDESFVQELKNYQADIFIVVAFRKLPKEVWSIPHLGTYNLHASLLPKYRGAAPINFAIINGEKETGVTTFKIQEEIDTGNIALQKAVPIEDTDNAKTIHDKLMNTGADLILETLSKIENKTLQLHSQDNNQATYAPKITKEFCQIQWNNTITNIYNFIRGLSPYPAAYTYININQKKTYCKILQVIKEIKSHQYTPGKIITDNKKYLKIACKDGFVDIQQIQAEGKKNMCIEEFLRGNKITTEECIHS